MKIDNVRPIVEWNAQRMEKRLRENDFKGKEGWHDGNFDYYYKKALSHLMKARDYHGDIYLAIKNCIDAENYVMMYADNLRDLLIKKGA